MRKGIELTYYSKATKTRQPANIYKINVNKIVRNKIKIKEKINIYIYIYIYIYKMSISNSKILKCSNIHQIVLIIRSFVLIGYFRFSIIMYILS